MVFRQGGIYFTPGSRLHEHLAVFLGYFLKKKSNLLEILSPRILLKIYPFPSEVVDEHGVIFHQHCTNWALFARMFPLRAETHYIILLEFDLLR